MMRRLNWAMALLSTVCLTACGARAETFVVSNTQDNGAGSLRAAIEAANTNPDSEIAFNIPPSDSGFSGGVWTIRPTSGLPILVGEGTVIDGATQTAFGGDTNPLGPEVMLDGALTESMATAHGLDITTSHCRINGLAIGNFPRAGIYVRGASTDNGITNCYMGSDATGDAAEPNNWGILIGDGAHDARIGGANGRNVLSGNHAAGLYVAGEGSRNNQVLNNLIGLNRDGTRALANGGSGVQVTAGADRNLISGNIISGNANSGIRIGSSAANEVSGNVIGLAIDQQSAVPNVFGVECTDAASGNLIGGASEGARNLISGNSNIGVFVSGVGSDNNRIQGNRIGTDASGNAVSTGDLNVPSGLCRHRGIERCAEHADWRCPDRRRQPDRWRAASRHQYFRRRHPQHFCDGQPDWNRCRRLELDCQCGRRRHCAWRGRQHHRWQITLSRPQSTLGAGTLVGVTWRGLTDAQQRAIPTGGSTFVVR